MKKPSYPLNHPRNPNHPDYPSHPDDFTDAEPDGLDEDELLSTFNPNAGHYDNSPNDEIDTHDINHGNANVNIFDDIHNRTDDDIHISCDDDDLDWLLDDEIE